VLNERNNGMITRREFIKICMSTAVSLSLTDQLIPIVGQAYADKKAIKPPVIWLELGSCTGNSVSLENAFNPSFEQLLTDMIDLR
jgi:hydrogenase small subunit